MSRVAPLPMGSVPGLEESFDRYRKALGFMNRWNDSMATPLEEEPLEVGEKHLADKGWEVGKHTG